MTWNSSHTEVPMAEVKRGEILSELDAIDHAVYTLRKAIQESPKHPDEFLQQCRQARAQINYMITECFRIKRESA